MIEVSIAKEAFLKRFVRRFVRNDWQGVLSLVGWEKFIGITITCCYLICDLLKSRLGCFNRSGDNLVGVSRGKEACLKL